MGAEDGDDDEGEEEEDIEVEEKVINGKTYYYQSINENNGKVYEIMDDEDIGEQIGDYVNGVLILK